MTDLHALGVVHDCEQDSGSELDLFPFEDEHGHPGDGPAVADAFLEWAGHYGIDTADLLGAPHCGAVAPELARRFGYEGYCVYDGDAYFALYPKGHCS